MLGRIAICSVGILVGSSGMYTWAQAPAGSPPGTVAGCTQPVVVCAPAKPRSCLFGPGLKGLFGGWCHPTKCQQPVACPTCAATTPRPVRKICATPIPRTQCAPTCGCAKCVVGRTPPTATIFVNGVPPAYNMVAVPMLNGQHPASLADLSGNTSAPTSPEPSLAAPSANPYAAFLAAMQNAQEKDALAIQEMMEHREANLAVIRSVQAVEANTVSAFEKLVRQMKEDSSKATPVPAMAAVPPDVAPAVPADIAPPVVPTYPIPSIPAAVPALPITSIPTVISAPAAGRSPKEIQALMEELDRLSQKVKELSNQSQESPDK